MLRMETVQHILLLHYVLLLSDSSWTFSVIFTCFLNIIVILVFYGCYFQGVLWNQLQYMQNNAFP